MHDADIVKEVFIADAVCLERILHAAGAEKEVTSYLLLAAAQS